MRRREYFDADMEHPLSPEQVAALGQADQIEVMRIWFGQNFEDPAERTPYQSAEGGYLYIWGGPYDAREELESEFSDIVPETLIEKLTSELEQECPEWAPTPRAEDYDDHLVDDIASISEFYHNFSGAILDIEKLLGIGIPGEVQDHFHRLLYVSVITAMETYLSDAFISNVMTDDAMFQRLVETAPLFKEQKFSLAEIYKEQSTLQSKVRSYLAKVVWHNLGRVEKMYKATCLIEFPKDLVALYEAVSVRHDIVHRNGRNGDGEEIYVGPDDVRQLIQDVEWLVQSIDQQWNR